MTSLIRHDPSTADFAPWRPSAPATPRPAPIDPEIARRDAAIIALERRLADMERAHEEALARARTEARRAALQDVARDESKALALLEANLNTATSLFARAIGDLERLAPLMCETALAPIFEAPAPQRDLVIAALTIQLHRLARESVVSVSVSAHDFTEAAHLKALSDRHPQVAISADATLTSGACHIALRLGGVEVDLPAHWAGLKAILNDMAQAP